MSDVPLAALLLVAFTMCAMGAGTFSVGAGLMVGGFLLSIWAWLLFGELPDSQDGET